MIVRVSSHKGGGRRKDAGLWHMVSGLISQRSGVLGRHYWQSIWSCKTPNEFPDWVEIQLPQRHSISRVVVYAVDNTLKDYEIQAYVSNRWVTVDTISGNKEGRIEHTFTPVVTDRIRVWITGTQGPHSIITEIEIYEK